MANKRGGTDDEVKPPIAESADVIDELDADEQDLEGALFRGALVNAVGLFAKVFMPIFFVAVTWLFGATIAGVFVVIYFYLEMTKSLSVTGYGDGATLFASRTYGRRRVKADASPPEVDMATLPEEAVPEEAVPEEAVPEEATSPDSSTPEGVIAASLVATVSVSLLVVALTWLMAGWLASNIYPQLQNFALALRIAILALPGMAVASICLAATKVRLRMEYEVGIAGFLVPVTLTIAAGVAAALGGGVVGLVIGFAIGHTLGGLLAAAALSRFFSWGEVLRQMPLTLRYRGLHRFAIPQGITLTLNNYQTRVDVLILGAFGLAARDVAFYSTGALLATLLREVRVVFSSALGPVVARLHAARDIVAFEALINRLSRLTFTLVVPPAILLVLFRGELLEMIDGTYTDDNQFMVILLVAPIVSCAVGLTGVSLGYTGHSVINLFNVVVVSVSNTVLNILWIPDYGIMGAATATALSGVLLSLLQAVELQVLEGVRLRPGDLYHPYLAAVPLLGILVVLWDVGELPLIEKVGFFVASMVAYGGSLLVVGHPEVRAWVRRRL